LLQSSKLVLRFGDSIRVFKSRFQNDDQGSEVHKFDSVIADVEENLIESVATKERDSETKAGLTIEVNGAAESELGQKRAKLIPFARERLGLGDLDGGQGGRAAGFGRLSGGSGLGEDPVGVLQVVNLKLAGVVHDLSLLLQIDLFLSVGKKVIELLLCAGSGGKRNRGQGTNVPQVAYGPYQQDMNVGTVLAGLLGDIVHEDCQAFDVDVEERHVEGEEGEGQEYSALGEDEHAP
jgi:hypothetical protein